jgi:hypothetical protein
MVIPVSRRIDRPDGSFGGVALVTLDLGYFGRFYDRFDVGREGTIVLALDDGTLLYRRPFNESLVGKDISKGPIFQTMRSTGPVGTAMLKSGSTASSACTATATWTAIRWWWPAPSRRTRYWRTGGGR